jgi:hypothetical protein
VIRLRATLCGGATAEWVDLLRSVGCKFLSSPCVTSTELYPVWKRGKGRIPSDHSEANRRSISLLLPADIHACLGCFAPLSSHRPGTKCQSSLPEPFLRLAGAWTVWFYLWVAGTPADLIKVSPHPSSITLRDLAWAPAAHQRPLG